MKKTGIKLSKLAVILIVVATVAVSAVCISSFASVYSKTLTEDAKVSSEQAVTQAALSVKNYFDSLKDSLEGIGLMIGDSESRDDFKDRISAYCAIRKDICAITVYDTDGGIITLASGGMKQSDGRHRDLSFEAISAGGPVGSDGFIISHPHVQTLFEGVYPWVVTIASEFDSALYGGRIYLAMDFSFYELAKYIDNVGIGRHGYCFITDADGIVYHPQQQLINVGLKSEPLEEILALEDGVHTKDGVIYAVRGVDDRGLRVVGVSYTDELKSEQHDRIALLIVLSLLSCLLISAAALCLFSKLVDRPVRRLVGDMKRFEKAAEAFEVKREEGAVAELDEISDSFSHMAKKITELMERVRNDQEVLRKTELRALEAQINPHFLYNTLDSICWMCERGNNADAVKMVSALAKLFRIGISRGRELITIREELEHAKSYLTIQSYRYNDRFTYDIESAPGLEDCLCTKITLQPLIENALYHGIADIDDGRITIRVYEDKARDDIIMCVADNGVGMTAEKCKAILNKEKHEGGIGVKNVSDRVAITFGEGYGVTIKSEPDCGCAVYVRLPKRIKEADDVK